MSQNVVSSRSQTQNQRCLHVQNAENEFTKEQILYLRPIRRSMNTFAKNAIGLDLRDERGERMKVYKPVSDIEVARRLGVTTINSAYYYLPIIQKIFGLGLVICERTDRQNGEWIQNDNGTWSCSLCQSWIPNEQHYYARFCLFCGEKMEGDIDEQVDR